MVGFLVTFWAAPTMTAGHMVFSALASAYILVGVRLEERDLRSELPEHGAYQATTAQFVPGVGTRRAARHSAHPKTL